MSPLDRRSFVGHTLTALGAAAAPAWLARAFGFAAPSSAAQDPQPAPKLDLVAWRKQQLAAALATAKAHGKPLLVLVVPDEEPLVWDAGQWFGAWLTHGDAFARETFGLCTLACARMGEVEAMAGVRGDAVARTTKPVTMLLVDPSQAGQEVDKPVRALRIEPELPKGSSGGWTLPVDMVLAEDTVSRRDGVAAMTEALQSGLAKHGASLAELAKASMAKLDAAQQKALATWVKDGTATPPELLVRGLAELRRNVADLPDTVRTARLAELNRAIEAVVLKHQVAGSRWMVTGGCHPRLESPAEGEDEFAMIPCGLAARPTLCRRFLNLYSAGS